MFTVGISMGFYEHLFLSVHITFRCRQGKLKGHGGNSSVATYVMRFQIFAVFLVVSICLIDWVFVIGENGKKLLSPRRHDDRSGISIANYRLSSLGLKLCEFINTYEE